MTRSQAEGSEHSSVGRVCCFHRLSTAHYGQIGPVSSVDCSLRYNPKDKILSSGFGIPWLSGPPVSHVVHVRGRVQGPVDAGVDGDRHSRASFSASIVPPTIHKITQTARLTPVAYGSRRHTKGEARKDRRR
jgi:hypothetical protein